MPDWKKFEGQVLDGKYALERYVSGDANGALFLIGFAATAVRIRRADGKEAATLLERWNRVRLLRHPHLLEIDAAGTATLDGEPVAYLVMEHAEENLGEILNDRLLTADEGRDMLLEVADALDFLHAKGLAHGELTASNILAVGDRVKLSTESVSEGDTKEDVRALGLTLLHALLRQHEVAAGRELESAAELPAPFNEIARGCLDPDSDRRWTARQVVARLRPVDRGRDPLPIPAPKPAARASKLRTLAAPAGMAAAALAVVAMFAVRPKEPPKPAPAEPPQRTAAGPPAPAPLPAAPSPKAPPTARPNKRTESSRDRLAPEDGIAERALPSVPEHARRTVTGKPAVLVRVTVDAAGNVTDAKLDKSFSPYFGNLALDAARRWKFAAKEGAGAREWLLRFEFTRTNTQATSRAVLP